MIVAQLRLVAAPAQEHHLVVDQRREVDQPDAEVPVLVVAAHSRQLGEQIAKLLLQLLDGGRRGAPREYLPRLLAEGEDVAHDGTHQRQRALRLGDSEQARKVVLGYGGHYL